MANDRVPLNKDLGLPQIERLKSRKPPVNTAKILHTSDFNPKEIWKEEWQASGYASIVFDFNNHSAKSNEFTLPRKEWCNLNRIRTGHGRCNDMLYKWRLINDPKCSCGNPRQTMMHLLQDCPIHKYNGEVTDFFKLDSRVLLWLRDLNL